MKGPPLAFAQATKYPLTVQSCNRAVTFNEAPKHVFSHDIGVTHDGWLAEKVVLPAAAVIRVPEALADADVAGLASAGLTAWNALVEVCSVKPGELVVCLGTGGVALAALQLAKVHGARVAITSSSNAKLALARKLGADITINYRTHPAEHHRRRCAGGTIGLDDRLAHWPLCQ